jgi:hypothetical protein
MSEILTESFCERCGTRYTFETEAPRAKRFGKFKVLSKGLKNYVLSDESSLDEALADARSDEHREASGQQLDAFHKTFNFCMSCRQYTCANCWNEVESRCLSCAPHLGHEVLETPFRTPDPFGRIASMGAAAAGNGHEVDLETILQGSSTEAAWPTTDLRPTPPAAETAEDAEADAVSRLESLFAIASRPDEPPEPAGEASGPIAAAADTPPTVPAPGEPVKRPGGTVPAKAAPEAATPPEADVPAPIPAKAADAPIPAKPATPVRDIAFEVSLFEEDAAQVEAEATAPAPAPAAGTIPAPEPVAADGGQPGTLASEKDLDERAAAALSQTADFLTRFRTIPGFPASSPIEPPKPAAPEPAAEAAAVAEPEPVVKAAPAPEPVVKAAPAPEPAVEAAAVPEREPATPAQQPVAADAVRPQVDRIEFPTWHIDTPAAAGPNGDPHEPAIIPTSPGPALQPSVQARWPAPEAPTAPTFPALPPRPAPTIAPQAIQPPAAMPPAAMPPAAMPPAAMPQATQPQWPEAPSWPVNQLRAEQVKGVDAMWAASSRDVLSRADSGVQACVNCGLPLSATARFCRRCGANQVPA